VFDYYGEPGHEVYSTLTGTNNPMTFTTTITGKEEFNDNMVKAFPIPFNDYLMLHINMEPNKSYKATITNLDGKVFRRMNIDATNQRIETADLAKGVYLLKLSDGKAEKVLKIIK
jgi:hypothetical protein